MWIQGIFINSKLLILLKIRTLFLCFVIFLFSICVGGIWNCTDHDCPGICIPLLFSHFITKKVNFSEDNRTIYDPRLLAANLGERLSRWTLTVPIGQLEWSCYLLDDTHPAFSHLTPYPGVIHPLLIFCLLFIVNVICHRWRIFTACSVPRPGIRISSLIGATLLYVIIKPSFWCCGLDFLFCNSSSCFNNDPYL